MNMCFMKGDDMSVFDYLFQICVAILQEYTQARALVSATQAWNELSLYYQLIE